MNFILVNTHQQTFSAKALFQFLTFFQFQRKPKRVGMAMEAEERCCGLLATAGNNVFVCKLWTMC